MKTAAFLCVVLLTTILTISCGNPAANSNAGNSNANTNSNSSASAAPSKEALFDIEKKANEAFLKNDTAHFESMLSDKFVSYWNGNRMTKADELKMISEAKCEAKSWNLDDAQMSKINDDNYVVAYKGVWDGTCTMDGKTEKIPTPVRAATVWHRDGSNWKAVFHGETLIVDPKNPPTAPPAAEKKEEPKKEEASNSKTASAPVKPAQSANSDAIAKIHQAGWEAFKARDAKWFNDHLSSNFGLVDPLGSWIGSKDETVKRWTETMKCEGINNVKVEDAVATSVSPTVEILTLKGTADGTCDGQKNGTLYQSAVYVKEGDTWKLAFMFESPAM